MPRPVQELIRMATELGAKKADAYLPEDRATFSELREAMDLGLIRCAEKGEDGRWKVNVWFKQAILAGFRLGQVYESEGFAKVTFFDKQTLPLRKFNLANKVRVVPGGTSVRAGAHVASGVIIMPPAFINIGAWVGEDTMVDSHVLVGSCAQIGKRVHLSAGVQIGGVLEPTGMLPVVVEDDVMVGGCAGIFEGTQVRSRAVIASGVMLNGSTKVYDLVKGEVYQRQGDQPLTIPEGAVVVPGSRPAAGDFAKQNGLMVATPLVVKYRDAKTDAATALEEALR